MALLRGSPFVGVPTGTGKSGIEPMEDEVILDEGVWGTDELYSWLEDSFSGMIWGFKKTGVGSWRRDWSSKDGTWLGLGGL